ncbi:MAG: flagellar basal-body rod protein FlgF [Deltaproteobacteria bacterium]|nr:flagellar basal-body rod protein FlgF [Candidatus Anaeroferrophillus wilburensis]MBN2889602.1 flagellar basal-body rod protein FlgF [Deltaproteobacteria bacterium]
MNHGIYTVLSGSLANERRLDVTANNLANVNTGGFKRDIPVFAAFLPPAAEAIPLDNETGPQEYVASAMNRDLWHDFASGSLRETGNPFDVALEGEAFFVVQRPGDGRELYTRNGNFRLNSRNELVTMNGDLVLGGQDKGVPLVVNAREVKIGGRGEIVADGVPIGRLRLVKFSDRQGLAKVGNSQFVATETSGMPQAADEMVVQQGVLELSNADPLTSMVDLIEISRHYELQQRMITTLGDLNQMAATEIAAV